MSRHTEQKLNRLLQDWPKGTVATQKWLEERGVYRQLTQRYLSSGWIERLGHGAFIRAGDSVDWLGGVYALQQQLCLGVRVGGATALGLKGYGHYIPLGSGFPVHLFNDKRERLPSWFVKHEWRVRIQYHCPKLFENVRDIAQTEVDHGNFVISVSAPERAILEVMSLAKTNADVDHALELLAGLTTLRPPITQSLLEACKSIKVKRLFLWAAENAHHGWFRDIDPSRINLGKGKRALYEGGQLDTKYSITVPPPERLPDV
jgi:hypothetical protein